MISERFNSQYHYWNPVANIPRPERTYEIHMNSVESDAATEIYVPNLQYPDGYYVWVSDGFTYFDASRQMLYWYPTKRKAGWTHTLRIEPWLPDREAEGWHYFYKDGSMLTGTGAALAIGGVL